MNSALQEKVKEIEDHEIEMRLLKKDDKVAEGHQPSDNEKAALCSSQSAVSLKHYDQVR